MALSLNPHIPTPAELLQSLIRFNTSNPPGDERDCALWIKQLFDRHSIDAQILAPDSAPHRSSVVARIQGAGKSPPLLLHGHIDVVGVQGQRWRHEPFAGRIADECVWGRGAVDMKGGLAMMIHALLRARKATQPPPGDIIMAAVADEEMGGESGAKFLVQQHSHLFKDVIHALGEIGGFTIHIRNRRFYPIMVAEKHICRIRVVFRADGGHGSQIHLDTAISKAAEAIKCLEKRGSALQITDTTREMMLSIASALPFPSSIAMRMAASNATAGIALRLMNGVSARMLEPMMRNTINPTIIKGGNQENALPAEVSMLLDCRLLPNADQQDIVRDVRRVIGAEPEIKVTRYDAGPPPADLALMPFLAEILERSDPGAKAIPFMVAGGTDAKWFATIGIDTYGFTPMLLPPEMPFMSLFHGANERIPVKALEFGAELMHQAITTYQE